MQLVEVTIEGALENERVEPPNQIVLAAADRYVSRRPAQSKFEVKFLRRVSLSQFNDDDAVGRQ